MLRKGKIGNQIKAEMSWVYTGIGTGIAGRAPEIFDRVLALILLQSYIGVQGNTLAGYSNF